MGFANNIANKRELKDKANILYVRDSKKTEYTDFIEKPLLLVSAEFTTVVRLNNKDYTYRSVVLTEEKSEAQRVYWNMAMPETNCLSPRSEYNHDGTLKRIVIREDAVQGRSMFKIKNIHWSVYVIRLDLAESVLRRKLYGFTLEELEHE